MSNIIMQISAKRLNRRIVIEVREQDGEHSIIVHTKRLVDFKNRHILTTTNIYGVETFTLLHQLFGDVLSEPTVAKRINKETKFPKWEAKVYLNK